MDRSPATSSSDLGCPLRVFVCPLFFWGGLTIESFQRFRGCNWNYLNPWPSDNIGMLDPKHGKRVPKMQRKRHFRRLLVKFWIYRSMVFWQAIGQKFFFVQQFYLFGKQNFDNWTISYKWKIKIRQTWKIRRLLG